MPDRFRQHQVILPVCNEQYVKTYQQRLQSHNTDVIALEGNVHDGTTNRVHYCTEKDFGKLLSQIRFEPAVVGLYSLI